MEERKEEEAKEEEAKEEEEEGIGVEKTSKRGFAKFFSQIFSHFTSPDSSMTKQATDHRPNSSNRKQATDHRPNSSN